MIQSNLEYSEKEVNWPTSEFYWVVVDSKGRECSEYFHHYYEAAHAMKYKTGNKGVRIKKGIVTY